MTRRGHLLIILQLFLLLNVLTLFSNKSHIAQFESKFESWVKFFNSTMMERNKPNRKTLRHAAQNLRIKLKSSYSVQRGKCSYQNYTRLGLMQARYDYRQFLNESQYGNHDIFVDDIGTADLSISDETSDNSTYIVEQFSLVWLCTLEFKIITTNLYIFK